MKLGVSRCSAYPVKVRRQQVQQESESLRPKCSPNVGPRHLPKLIIEQGHHVGGRGLVRRYSTCERFEKWVVPTGYPRG